MRILVTTFGRSWQIIPELLGFTNPELVDLYKNHPSRDEIESSRTRYNIRPCDELWVIGTSPSGPKDREAQDLIQDWRKRLPRDFPIRVWLARGMTDITTVYEARMLGDLILRVVAKASRDVGYYNLILSLTGGRKTMSSDMQHAASVFGCSALLHIIETGFSEKLRAANPEFLSRPLPPDDAKVLLPVVTGSYGPNKAVDLGNDEIGQHYTDPGLPPPDAQPAFTSVSTSFYDAVDRVSQNAQNLLFNYKRVIGKGGDTATGYRALYTLSPDVIQKLKEVRLTAADTPETERYAFVQRLPKADLHCHLGGIATPAEAIEIARENQKCFPPYEQALQKLRGMFAPLIAARDSEGIRERLSTAYGPERPLRRFAESFDGVPPYVVMSAFLLMFEKCPEVLDTVVYGNLASESAFCGIDIQAYEALGDVQGSLLLQTEAAIRKAVQLLVKKARADNVRYLELRCSPENYTRAGLGREEVVRVMRDELARADGLDSGLIIIASRHRSKEEMQANISLVEKCRGSNLEFDRCPIIGFDLAGDEQAAPPEKFRDEFKPVMEHCLGITIHAGETANATSIWQAVYHLSAERIGHGLTLGQDEKLLSRFLVRKICVEMCPSSNFQVRGFRDYAIPETQDLETYPLGEYLEKGLIVTINTDNMGISRTCLSREYLKAARMTEGGLTLWDVLRRVRNGFKASFLPFDLKRALLRRSEDSVMQCIENGIPS